MRVAAQNYVLRPQIWIPEIEYYQKMSSHAQTQGPHGAEKELIKVYLGAGWWYWWYLVKS